MCKYFIIQEHCSVIRTSLPVYGRSDLNFLVYEKTAASVTQKKIEQPHCTFPKLSRTRVIIFQDFSLTSELQQMILALIRFNRSSEYCLVGVSVTSESCGS